MNIVLLAVGLPTTCKMNLLLFVTMVRAVLKCPYEGCDYEVANDDSDMAAVVALLTIQGHMHPGALGPATQSAKVDNWADHQSHKGAHPNSGSTFSPGGRNTVKVPYCEGMKESEKVVQMMECCDEVLS